MAPTDPETPQPSGITNADVVEYAAMVLLHRELTKSAQVTLTQADFETYHQARFLEPESWGIKFNTNEAGDVLLTQVKKENDA